MCYINYWKFGKILPILIELIVVKKLLSATAWLKSRGQKGFLAAFAGGRNQLCYEALDDLLNFIENNSDAWVGYVNY